MNQITVFARRLFFSILLVSVFSSVLFGISKRTEEITAILEKYDVEDFARLPEEGVKKEFALFSKLIEKHDDDGYHFAFGHYFDNRDLRTVFFIAVEKRYQLVAKYILELFKNDRWFNSNVQALCKAIKTASENGCFVIVKSLLDYFEEESIDIDMRDIIVAYNFAFQSGHHDVRLCLKGYAKKRWGCWALPVYFNVAGALWTHGLSKIFYSKEKRKSLVQEA